jgi:hypothetical protein
MTHNTSTIYNWRHFRASITGGSLPALFRNRELIPARIAEFCEFFENGFNFWRKAQAIFFEGASCSD